MILYNARLIDGTGRVWQRAAIHIADDRITTVTDAEPDSTDEPALNLGGKTVVPGFINCHVHLCLDGSPDPITAWALPAQPSTPSLRRTISFTACRAAAKYMR